MVRRLRRVVTIRRPIWRDEGWDLWAGGRTTHTRGRGKPTIRLSSPHSLGETVWSSGGRVVSAGRLCGLRRPCRVPVDAQRPADVSCGLRRHERNSEYRSAEHSDRPLADGAGVLGCEIGPRGSRRSDAAGGAGPTTPDEHTTPPGRVFRPCWPPPARRHSTGAAKTVGVVSKPTQGGEALKTAFLRAA